ncbi:trimeric intracellular cation channel family protein [Cumulibacter manganitolerans]|uniref:trimeric intracellular cation channel family protein n=1 Tax=Cumulibacter manganitolerans TaxID=1884992 RepID=UPI001296CC66|nr:TRIC cation channel family protein [Cumulibacter manganitolerans]
METQVLSQVVNVLDLTGVLANALLGGAVARQHRLDPVGFAVLAVLSGLGGGMLRDVLIQAGPPVALTDPWYLGTALVGAGLAFLITFEGTKWWDRIFPWVDALALGTWAAVGTQRALSHGLGVVPSVLLGAITAVGGGAVRDIALGKIPTVLGGNTLYATAALAAGGTLAALSVVIHPSIATPVASVVGAAITLLARWRGWILPDRIYWGATPVRRIVDRRRRGTDEDAAAADDAAE